MPRSGHWTLSERTRTWKSISLLYDNSWSRLGALAPALLTVQIFKPPLLPEGKHLLLKSHLTIFPALEYASLKVYVFGFYRCYVQWIICWDHLGLANVMLSGVIKIFRCLSRGENVSGTGFKRFMPLRLSVSHCTLSLGLSMCLRFAYILYFWFMNMFTWAIVNAEAHTLSHTCPLYSASNYTNELLDKYLWGWCRFF